MLPNILANGNVTPLSSVTISFKIEAFKVFIRKKKEAKKR